VSLVTRGLTQSISTADLHVVAALFDLAVPDEDRQALAESLADQLRSIDRLERLDLTDVNPVLEFDPRWHD
jgi:Asp-tRNA(Asn)/Glu-tRNA(Gln) amidotransferase C subunit